MVEILPPQVIEVGALGSNIVHIQQNLRRQLMLNTEVPSLGVGQRIRTNDATDVIPHPCGQSFGIAKRRYQAIPRCASRIRKRIAQPAPGSGPIAQVGGLRIRILIVTLIARHTNTGRTELSWLIEDAIAGADYCRGPHSPGKAEARCDSVVIDIGDMPFTVTGVDCASPEVTQTRTRFLQY